jgi:hypothetical protein
MKHKEVGPLQHGEGRKKKRRKGRRRGKTFIARNMREKKQYETIIMNNEH